MVIELKILAGMRVCNAQKVPAALESLGLSSKGPRDWVPAGGWGGGRAQTKLNVKEPGLWIGPVEIQAAFELKVKEPKVP